VLHRVRQGLLDKPEDGQLDAGGQIGGNASVLVADGQAGGLTSVAIAP
jgi:hypothetical protein